MAKIPFFKGKKDLVNMSEDEIRTYLRALDNDNKFTEGEIEGLVKKRDLKFKEGLNSSATRREMLARDIINLDKQVDAKRRLISNNLELISGLSAVADSKLIQGSSTSAEVISLLDKTNRSELNKQMTKAAFEGERASAKAREFSKTADISIQGTEPEKNQEVSKIMEGWASIDQNSSTLSPNFDETSKSVKKGEKRQDDESQENENI